jgi:hypothetical protein
VFYSVTRADYVDGHRLALRFADGSEGVVDFAKYVRRGGVFEKLADLDVFKSFKINADFGVVSWGDVDIAPETLYDEAHKTKSRRRPQVLEVAETRSKYVTGRKKG